MQLADQYENTVGGEVDNCRKAIVELNIGFQRLSTPPLKATCNLVGQLKKKKKRFFFSVNVFSTKVLIGDTIFTSPAGNGKVISA